MVPHAADIILVASKAVGTLEEPLGSNDGAALRKLLSDTAWKPGEAWCMFYAEHCIKEGFAPNAMPDWITKDGSCNSQYELAKQHGKISTYAATGSLFLVPERGGYHHCGLVAGILGEGTTISTIEGNTNEHGEREGFAVYRHARKIESVVYVVW